MPRKNTLKKTYNVAIAGATGMVGQTFIEILEQRRFPVGQLFLLASERSVGKVIQFKEHNYKVMNIADFDFSQAQLAFFSAGSAVSAKYVPQAAAVGCVVIDNSSQFRNERDVPLVVPEVNAHTLKQFSQRNIIANPNCSTIQMVVALKPIYDQVGIRRINVATYQSVSGAGQKGVEELAVQASHLLNGQPIVNKVFPRQIAFNVVPQIGPFRENGYSEEEMKMVLETQKIFEDKRIAVNPTTVRTPVFFGHSEAVSIETKEPIAAAEAIKLLNNAPGVTVHIGDDYPTSLNAATHDGVFVGRIRNDLFNPKGLNLWIVSDNVRKGAALNGIQIAELLIQQKLI